MFLFKRGEKQFFFPSWIIDLHRCYTGGKGYSVHHRLLWIFHIKHFNRSILSCGSGCFSELKIIGFRNWKLSFFQNFPVWENKPNIWGGGRNLGCFGFVFSEIISSFLRSRSSHHLLTYFEHGECSRAHATVPFLSSVWRHCRSCIHHKQLKATELYQTSLGRKSPQDQPNGLVIDTWGKRNVAAFLHIVLQH